MHLAMVREDFDTGDTELDLPLLFFLMIVVLNPTEQFYGVPMAFTLP